ncbi:hypothetical protein GJ496_000938 [Pomphorhynchus laevis]|nr:hypothetical protein GJ496_000938 [Pomphorhynchus laevis]
MDPFLQAKYKWLFAFFDYNNNGSIEKSDFNQRAERASTAVLEHFKHQENCEEMLNKYYESIKKSQISTYGKFFEELLKTIDLAGDNKISIEEWLIFCQKVKETVDTTEKLPKWFEDILTNYFNEVLDFNGNGKIEFYEMCFMGDAPIEVTWYCFDKLTDSNKIPLDLPLFIEMCTLYLSTNDPQSKSRYIFGFTENETW